MGDEKVGLYALYMSTHGNMPEVFAGYPHASALKEPMIYDVPQSALDADPRTTDFSEMGISASGNVYKNGDYYYYKALFTPSDVQYESKYFWFRVNVEKASGSELVGASALPTADSVISGTKLSEVNLNSEGIDVYVYNYFSEYEPAIVSSQTQLLSGAYYEVNYVGEYVRSTVYAANKFYFTRKYIPIPGVFEWENASAEVTTATTIYRIKFTPDEEFAGLVEGFTRTISLVVYTDASCFEFREIENTSHGDVEADIYLTGLKNHNTCGGHENIVILDHVTNNGKKYHIVGIDPFAFQNQTVIKTMVLPSSIKEIGDYAFNGCVNLTEINLPTDLETIGEHAFDSCTSLGTVKMQASYLKSIGEFAFFHDTKLVSFRIPDSITEIGKGAFADCVSLTNLTIEENEYYKKGGSDADWFG